MSDVDLVQFLLARIAEDEEAWAQFEDDGTIGTWSHWGARDCEAKRRIIRLCSHERTVPVTVRKGVYKWQTMQIAPYEGDEGWDVLAALALPYADHEDYDQSWSR